MRHWWLVGVLLLLAACAPQAPICAEPYMVHENGCCLDKDTDGVCDQDQAERTEGTALDCSLCPPEFVTDVQEVIVYKYVCMDGTVVDDEGSCGERIESNAHLFTPVKTENAEGISVFEARPACRGTYRAVEFHLAVEGDVTSIIIQMMDEPNTSYEDITSIGGTNNIIDDEYIYVGFCDTSDCSGVIDKGVPATTAYMARALVSFGDDDRTTKEIVIDPTPEGEYGRQC